MFLLCQSVRLALSCHFTMYVGQLSFPRREVNIEIRIRESVKVALVQPEVQCGDHEGKFIL